MIFYHGTNKLFDKFDTSYSFCGDDLYVSPCKKMSLSYIPRTGGYLYTLEIDESNKNYSLSKEYGNENCKCRAYSDVSNFKIIKVEKIGYDGIPAFETECGSFAIKINRNG